MSRFMFLQHGDCQGQTKSTPEQQAEGMKAWQAWMEDGKKEGWLLDPGSPLGSEAAIVRPDLSVTDGPLVEAKEVVGGYTIVEAENIDAACELAKRTMKLAGSGRIEVREFACFGEEE
ncbi:MAG TPA: hypothetical protein DDW52_15260 [Planctomycetaceae bacterium]|nr:hypothetical protein [Planctomycetaceae bacterium]